MAKQTDTSDSAFLVLAFSAFLLFGVILVLVGASHESMSLALDLGIEQMALLGATLSLGIGAGVVIAGPLVDRFPRRPLFSIASVIAALALLGVEPDISFARATMHVVAMGFGGGLCETLINTVTVERFGTRAIRPLTILHSAATVGAVAAPALVGLLVGQGDWTSSFRAAGAGWAVIAVATLFVPLAPVPASTTKRAKALLSPRLLALCAVAFAYVGIEAGLTLFAVPYATHSLELDAGRGRSAISSFWFGLLLGRLALAALTSRTDPRFLLGAGLGAALVLAACIGTGWSQIEIMVGLTGVSVGLVFPVMVTLAGEWFPESRGTATGLVIGVGCIGGFAVPWLTGLLAESASVAIAVGSLAAWGLVIALAAYAADHGQRVANTSSEADTAAVPTQAE